jgi:recombination protein RecA
MAKKGTEKNNEKENDEIFEYFQKELGAIQSEKIEDFISTGSTLLDYAIANRPNGGVPVGRITEIVGGEGSGKSLLAYHILANTQKRGGIAVYIDTERAYNKQFMERMGVNTKKNFIMPEEVPGSIEEVFAYIEKVVTHTRLKFPEKNKLVTVIWDSVAATPGKDELEVAHTDNPRMATEARAMSRSFRKVISALDSGYVTLICINQLREKIGLSFGDGDTTPHGKALPFYASVRIKLKSLKQIKDTKGDRTIGVSTQAKVYKNKVGPNWRVVDFPLMYDWGVADEVSWVEFLKDLEHIKTSGAWSTLTVNGEDHKFQGVSGWRELLNNESVKKFVAEKIEEKMVIKFDRKPDSIDIDPESALEIEQLKSDLER